MRPRYTLTPTQILFIGFTGLSLLGTLLLMLPLASQSGSWQPFMDALFTSTSAVTGTGLVVVGTGSYYNLFGQLVLLILFQIGGLGYMTLIVFIMTLLGQKLSLQGGMLMQQSLAGMSRGRIYIFVRRVIYFTLIFQGVGAAAIALRLWSMGEYSLPYSLYAGVFHAVSAFCTAGFSLWDSNFVAYQNDVWLNLIINSLSLSGAIGFLVLHESIVYYHNWRQGKRHYLSIHTRLALIMVVVLSLMGTVLIATVEYDPGQSLWSLFLTASFQTISASSTAGFNTIDLAEYSDTSQAILALLMFIGAPAGGTGGGIKATTFAVLLLSLRAMVQGNWDVNVFHRRIPINTLINTIGVVITGTLWLLAATLVLTVLEPHSFLALVFELASALGTAGLSLGITPLLSDGGKLVVVLTMLVGRVGPLSVAFSLARQRRAAAYRLPSEEVWVG